MWPLIIASLISGGISYGAGKKSERRQRKELRNERRMAQGRADYLRKWTHPQQRVEMAERDLGGAGKLFDDRRAQLADAQALEMSGAESAVESANNRSKMLREQLQAMRLGGAANALGGMAAIWGANQQPQVGYDQNRYLGMARHAPYGITPEYF